MTRFYERGTNDNRLGLVWDVQLPDHDGEMFRDIGVEVSALCISRTIGAGNFLFDR